jgi:hypothetical protein
MEQISKSLACPSYSLIDELSLKTQTSYNDFNSLEGRYFREERRSSCSNVSFLFVYVIFPVA